MDCIAHTAWEIRLDKSDTDKLRNALDALLAHAQADFPDLDRIDQYGLVRELRDRLSLRFVVDNVDRR